MMTSPLPAPLDSSGAIVQIRKLEKSFGPLPVLKGIDLDVSPGEKVALIGPSGSGKTTLLRCINYLERPTAGHVYVAGELMGERLINGRYRIVTDRELSAARSNIGMVFQRFNLFPHLTVLENVMAGPLRVQKCARAVAEERALNLLDKVGLREKRSSYPSMLSGGQQQRVAIARALAMTPKLMLFDEATSALDPDLVGEVLRVIQDLASEGMTMIMVTHEMEFAKHISDRVVFMADGNIIEQGPPNQLFDNPSDARTRSFLRTINERVTG
jgi:ABC-type polar amino acid transport system ATPase subunit